MKKFAFYTSNKAGRLKNFLIKYSNNRILRQISFILIDNKENDELRVLCKNLSIRFIDVDYLKDSNMNEYISEIFLRYLNRYQVDMGFVFADKILVGNILDQYKNRLINFHPSLLPSHKGLYAIDQALEKKSFLLGNSAHIITSKVDEGCVIMQNIVPRTQYVDHETILNNQLIMLIQLMYWIDEDRLIFEDDLPIIKNAKYNVSAFIPNLELAVSWI